MVRWGVSAGRESRSEENFWNDVYLHVYVHVSFLIMICVLVYISRLVVLSAVVGINNLAVTLLCNLIKNKWNFQLLR